MPGLEQSINMIREYKESHKKLEANPRLIAIDGPDGVGKTTIAHKLVELLKNKALEEHRDPNTIEYVKYTKFDDTRSQHVLKNAVHNSYDRNLDATGEPFSDQTLKFFAARISRSYHDHIVPLLEAGKTVVLDRSEFNIIRAVKEWGSPEFSKKIEEYYKNGTMTQGITAGNRVFITGTAEDIWKNLQEREGHRSHNDPDSFQEVAKRLDYEKEAEAALDQTPTNGTVHITRIISKRNEDHSAYDMSTTELAKKVMEQLVLK